MPFALLVLVVLASPLLGVASPTAAPSASPTSTRPLRVLIMDWISSVYPSLDLYNPVEQQAIASHFLLAAAHWNERNAQALPLLGTLDGSCPNISVLNYCDEAGNSMVSARHVNEYIDEADVIVGFQSLGVLASTVLAQTVRSVPVVSYWTTESELDDKTNYPLYARIPIGDSDYQTKLALFVQALNYTRVAVIALDSDEGPRYLQTLESVFASFEIETFSEFISFNDSASIASALSRIRETALNVIIYAGYETDIVEHVAPLATELGLNTPDKLWLFTNFDIAVTPAETQAPYVNELMQGSLRLDYQISQPENFAQFTANWASYEPYRPAFNAIFPPHGTYFDGLHDWCRSSTIQFSLPAGFFNDSSIGSQGLAGIVGAHAYDSVIAAGLAACLSPGNYGATLWTNLATRVSFSGMSGPVHFDNVTGSRLPSDYEFTVVVYGANVSQVTLAWFAAGNWTFNLTRGAPFLRLGYLPMEITPSVEDFQYLPRSMVALGLCELCFTCLLCLSLAVWMGLNRYNRVVVQAQPVFMYLILLGCALSSFSVLGFMMDESFTSTPDVGCTTAPIVFAVGLFLALTALWGKTYRLASVFSPQGLHIGISVERILFFMSLLMGGMLVVVILYWQLAPLTWSRSVVQLDAHGFPLVSLGMCAGGNPGTAVLLIVMFAMNFMCVLYTSAEASRMKNVPEEFREAIYISMSTSVLFQVALLSVPVTYAVYDSVVGRFIILSSIVFFSDLAIVLPIFVPKLSKAKSKVSANAARRPQSLSAQEIGVLEGLRIARIREKFIKFAAQAQTTEHPFFLCDVDAWKQNFSALGDSSLDQARALVKMYIKAGAMLQNNISAKTRLGIEKAVAADAVSVDVFDPAIDEVVQLMNFGTWADFCEDGGLYGLDVQAPHEAVVSGYSSTDRFSVLGAAHMALARVMSSTSEGGDANKRKPNKPMPPPSSEADFGGGGDRALTKSGSLAVLPTV